MSRKELFFLAFFFLLANCERSESVPVYSNIPHIEAPTLTFTDTGNPTHEDTLNLSFDIKDGDLDLGYDQLFENPGDVYFSRTTGQPFQLHDLGGPNLDSLGDAIKFSDRATIDTLPGFVHPHDCINWRRICRASCQAADYDTVYYQISPRFYNIFVRWYFLDNAIWKEFSWETYLPFPYPNCGTTFNSRFPELNPNQPVDTVGPFTFTWTGPKRGRLQYKMRSVGFNILFGGKKIKLKVRIQDRAFNKSNELESPEYQF